ncbi:MAG: STAS domain-containing protein [Myxococcaceae bacterium]|nr:STAS domain-containing protein [Myxococcaceae bacterium]
MGSISVMKLGDCLFVSVPEELRDSQVRDLQETVSGRLSQDAVRGVVIDVSALSIIDSFVARVLGDTAAIARSFGARGVLVGVRPAVATTLVDLGIDLSAVETALNLERALEKLHLKVISVS